MKSDSQKFGNLFRVAIVGAATLKGKELKDVLEERNFPAMDIRLLDDNDSLGQLEQVQDAPRRRPPRDRDEDDCDDEPPRRRRGFRCPYCGTDEPPRARQRVSVAGWVVFAVLLLFCFPLCLIGLFITEEEKVCWGCGLRLG